MSTQVGGPAQEGSVNATGRRMSSSSLSKGTSLQRKKAPSDTSNRKPSARSGFGGRTVKKLRLLKALTISEGTTVFDACQRMAARKVDAALLTDSSSLLCGIITDKDVATRVIAEGLNPEVTPVSKVMTKNPLFVMSDTLAVDALQKMVQGRFRHLPVVENQEVIALLDITKCLYDAISRMEKAAEKGDAIVAAVQGVEREWGENTMSTSSLVDMLGEKMFRPSLSSVIYDSLRLPTCSPGDTISIATKKMRELHASSVIISTANNKLQGILTSKDVLTRVVAQSLQPEATPVEKVMTPNPECATIDTSVVDALHIMHDGKFLHLPVIDRGGCVVACLDILHLTHAAVATVGGFGGTNSDLSGAMLQKLWDSAFSQGVPADDDETHSEASLTKSSVDNTVLDQMKYPSLGLGSTFTFKFKDGMGRVHRFNSGTESLTELISAIAQRIGHDQDVSKLSHVMYEDDEGDRVVLAKDSDLVTAVSYARSLGWKVLKLHLDIASSAKGTTTFQEKFVNSRDLDLALEIKKQHNWSSPSYSAAVAGAAVLVSVSMLVLLKRPNIW